MNVESYCTYRASASYSFCHHVLSTAFHISKCISVCYRIFHCSDEHKSFNTLPRLERLERFLLGTDNKASKTTAASGVSAHVLSYSLEQEPEGELGGQSSDAHRVEGKTGDRRGQGEDTSQRTGTGHHLRGRMPQTHTSHTTQKSAQSVHKVKLEKLQ